MTANSFQTQINLDQIRGKLRDALRSDSGKGGDGMLDTREVAEGSWWELALPQDLGEVPEWSAGQLAP